jgi:hypothetical protein
MAGAIRLFVMANTAGPTAGAYPHDHRQRRSRGKTMPGFELIGVGFVALCFTALQFAWLLESAKV